MKPRSLPINKVLPMVMHIDLNSCFAIIEQQANSLLRGRPVAIAAYDTPRGFIIASSYEAKRLGIKLGINVSEARQIDPKVIILTPDPSKYREAHKRFREILQRYSSDVVPKSIDEFVLNMSGTPAHRRFLSLYKNGVCTVCKNSDVPCPDCHADWMRSIGVQIKQDISESLGEAVTVNVGIGPNRFLAKLAAGLHKPNGMDLIDYRSIESTFSGLELMDFPGINTRYNRRLKEACINTPLQFLASDCNYLQRRVFQSIVGYYWYLRMRGYEIDNYETKQRSIGHQYALSKKTTDVEELARLMAKLCEKVGRRLRKDGLCAKGIHLYLSFMNYQQIAVRGNGFIGGENMHSNRAWHKGQKTGIRLYNTQDIYLCAKKLLHEADIHSVVRGMSITVYELAPCDPEQLELFGRESLVKKNKMHESTPANGQSSKNEVLAADQMQSSFDQRRRISDALDSINTRYGEYVVTPGNMMDMKGTILDRVAFGSVRNFD